MLKDQKSDAKLSIIYRKIKRARQNAVSGGKIRFAPVAQDMPMGGAGSCTRRGKTGFPTASVMRPRPASPFNRLPFMSGHFLGQSVCGLLSRVPARNRFAAFFVNEKDDDHRDKEKK